MSRRINILIPTLLIMITLVQSCGPSVTLSVQPSHVCSGETVTITWDAPGDVSFAANPSADVRFDMDMTSGLPSEGSMSATVETVADKATIIATASLPGGGSIANSVDVDVILIDEGQLLSAVGACSGAVPTWNTYVPPSEWSDKILVEWVENINTVDITVTHAGVANEVIPAGRTTLEPFKGTTFEGGWSFGTFPSLHPSYRCGSLEGGEPLEPIEIYVRLYCG